MKQYETSVYRDEVTGMYAYEGHDGIQLVEDIYEASEIPGITWGMCKFESQTGAQFVPVDVVVERVVKILT